MRRCFLPSRPIGIETHWQLCLAANEQPDSEWWLDISRKIREMHIGDTILQPLVAAKRLYQALISYDPTITPQLS